MIKQRPYLLIILSFGWLSAIQAQTPDLRGPIHSEQFTVNQTPEGIFATKFSYQPFQNSALNGNWIWIDPDKYPHQQSAKAHYTGSIDKAASAVINFKKIITVNDDVDEAHIKISADIQYRLFVNGKLTESGPANIGSDFADPQVPQHWFYDEFTSKQAFKKGKNTIAIEVSTFVKTMSSTTTGHGGLIMEADIKLSNGKNLHLQTDTTWKCNPSKAYQQDLSVDASNESFKWITTEHDENGWSNAVILPASLTSKWKLRQSELPQMMEKSIAPAKISTLTPAADSIYKFPIHVKASFKPQKIRLEFDNLYTGFLAFKVTGKAGNTLNFVTREANNKAQELNYTLQNGEQTFEFPELIDGKYIDVTVTNPDGELTINEASIIYSGYPVTYTGTFSCSDTLLNSVWKNIRWVTQMNMQTYHMDSPLHQEPVSDAGDYLIESMVNYYTFSSPLLIKQDLRKIALVLAKTDYSMFHTSYMLLWEQMLLNYYHYTGDQKLLAELAPTVYNLLNKFHSYIGNTGIITEAPNYMFMDWVNIGNITLHHPPAALGEGYLTAFYYKALINGGEIAQYLGHQKKSAAFLAEAVNIKTAFNQVLFDKQTMLYKNGLTGITKITPGRWLPKDTSINIILPYANALAVAYGITPPGTEKHIVDKIVNQKEIATSPYFMYFVFDALNVSNTFDDYGFTLLRRWKQLSQNPVGLKEGWAMGDNSHAWGGSAAYELSSKVLGICPAKPGFKEVYIAPHIGDLKWAKGSISTANGEIAVSWKNSDDSFEIESETNSLATDFILPFKKNFQLIINGKKVKVENKTYKDFKVLLLAENRVEITTTKANNHILMLKSRLN